MSRLERERVREVVRSAFWLVPALCVGLATAAALGVLAIDHLLGPTSTGFLFPGPPQGARTLLSSIIQAMITFTGLVFSITIVVLQLTSAQFSPRVLRSFLIDRTIRLSLGIFLATFVYAMVVLRDVRGAGASGAVPRLAVTVAVALVLLSVGMFIRYVAHIVNMIRAATIIDSVGSEARATLARAPAEERSTLPESLPAVTSTVCADRPGVLVSVNVSSIVQIAQRESCVVVLLRQVGEFVAAGMAVAHVHGRGDVDRGQLLQRLSFANERTMTQDIPFAFRQLVDIAQRALSPGINDPTTAVQAIDVLHDLLRRLAVRPLTSIAHRDSDGAVRLIVPQLTFAGYLGLAVGQIWRYGADAVQVPQRMTTMLLDLHEVALPEHRAPIERWLSEVQPAGRRDPTWNTATPLPNALPNR